MTKSRRSYLACEGLCLIAALVWAMVSFRNNHPLFQKVGVDNAIFLSIGKGITQGIVPYVELTENKGPLFFLLMALPQLVLPGSAGVYVLEVLFMLLSCLTLLFLVRIVMGENRHALAAAVLILLYVCTPCNDDNFCEEYDLFFMLLSVAAVAHLLIRGGKGAWRAWALGISTAGVALIKISDLPGIGIAVLVYFCFVARKGRDFLREALRYVLGMLLVAAPVFIYLIRVDAVGAMFQEYILDNFAHVAGGEEESFVQSRLALLFSAYGLRSLIPVVAMGASVALRCVRRKGFDWLDGFGLALAVANLGVGYIASSGFMQHLLMGSATLYLAVGMLFAELAVGEKPSSIPWKTVLAVALCVLVCGHSLMKLSDERLSADLEEIQAFWDFQQEFLPEVEDCESVCTLGVGIMPDWYWINGLQPAFRYYNISGFIMYNVGSDVAQEFEDFLLEEPCEYLVLDHEIEFFREQLTEDTIAFIYDNYELVTEGSQGRLLMRYI